MDEGNNQKLVKKTEPVDDQVLLRNKIYRLPDEDDVFLDIVCRLPIKSLVQFRLVCRVLNKKLSNDPVLVNLQLSHAVKKDPCVIFISWNRLSYVDLSDHENNEQELPRFTGIEGKRVTIGFGFHPSTKEYKVVKIVYYRSKPLGDFKLRSEFESDVQILYLSSSKWRRIGQAPYHLHTPSTGVLVNGRLHWVTEPETERLIVSFDLGDEPDFSGSLTSNYDISVLGGCLSAGLRFPSSDVSLQIWVMKVYNVKESWECVCSITSNSPPRSVISALCRLKNGEILLNHINGTLVSYDPKSKETRNFMLKGMPDYCIPIVHVGSLSWIDS